MQIDGLQDEDEEGRMEDNPDDPKEEVEEEKTYEVPMRRKYKFLLSKNVVKTTMGKSKNNVVKTAESGLKEVELASEVKTTESNMDKTTESNLDTTGAESGDKKNQEWKTVHRRKRKSSKEEEVTATGTKEDYGEDSGDVGCNVKEKVDWLKQIINEIKKCYTTNTKHTLKATESSNADFYTECM